MIEIDESVCMQLLNFDTSKRQQWINERKPFSVLFELTAKCNMNCIHCYLQNNHSATQMTYERIIEIIDVLYDKGILFLTFTGGEILTRDDFLDIYLYAKKKGFLVELFTNGYLFTDEIIEVLKKYPPLLVDISLYGSNEETYYKVTGVKNAFEQVVNNCKKLKRAGIRTALKSPIMKDTLHELQEMRTLAQEIGVPFVFSFELCATIDKDETPKELQVSLADVLQYEFRDYYRQIEEGVRPEKVDNSKIVEELKNNKYVYACNVALNSFVIDYQGKMCPCMKLRHKGIEVNREVYDRIWEGFRIYSQLEASKTYVCNGCDAHYYCDVCPAEMDFLYGDMEYRPLDLCRVGKIRKEFYEGKITFEEAMEIAALDKNK